ncbi:hypothetical protein RMSM_03540 [Rhodopirellula maiorica SM1]|uniref:Uncharacterized protein n=1 Tax=Rhodopirellula maiorica SM1 TaxID=1265738 RepID=M5S031_9BACT|nr:hypothetical protein RMSM_03540 [Rhodopirellula maiorica SM1]
MGDVVQGIGCVDDAFVLAMRRETVAGMPFAFMPFAFESCRFEVSIAV